MIPPELPPAPPRKRKLGRFLGGLAVLALVIWLAHPVILASALRVVIDKGIAMAGWQVSIGELSAALDRPWILRDVKIWARDPQKSGTDVFVDRLEISFNLPWEKFAGIHRFIDAATVAGIHGKFDLRPEALPPPYMPELPPDEQKKLAATIMQFLPISAHVRDADLEFIGPGQSYRLVNGVADFYEDRPATLTIEDGFVRAGQLTIDTGPLSAVTGWKDGTASLTGLVFRPDIKVDLFRARFANVGGIALDLDAKIFGGTLAGEIIFTSQHDLPAMDTYVVLKDFDLGALSALMTWQPPIQGTVEKARYTFKGIPERVWNATSSLDMRVVKPHWQDRSCDAVEVAFQHHLRQVKVSRFFVQAGSNTLLADGTTQLDEKGEFNVQTSPFQIQGKGTFLEVSQLASLLGPPASHVTGRMDLQAETARETDGIRGQVTLDGQGLAISGQPVDEAHLAIQCADNEATISRLEIKAGEDTVRGAGKVALTAPHAYAGEVDARLRQLASYLDLLGGAGSAPVYSGEVNLHWLGRGNTKEHWAEFDLSLQDVFSVYTQSGVSGRLVGSYSPESIEVKSLTLTHGALELATQASLTHDGITVPDALLKSGTTPLGHAQIFLPLDVPALVGGKPLKDAWQDADIRAAISSKGPLKISDLAQLSGQAWPVTGTVSVDLQAGGRLTSLNLKGDFQGRDLVAGLEDTSTPPASFNATLNAANGLARLDGSLSTQGMPPLTVKAEMPFGFVWSPQNDLVWTNPDGRLTAQVVVPQTDLGVFRSLIPSFRRLQGTISGGVSVTGTMAHPQMDGRITLSNGLLQAATRAPAIGNIQGTIRFDAGRADIERFTGELAAGPFSLKGGFSFADPKNLRYDFSLTGRKLLLARDPGLRLRADIDIEAKGDNNSGLVRGEVAFVDGRVYRRLEITPLLVPSPVSGPLFVPPDFTGLVPAPFSQWTVDLHVRNATPFKLVGNIASGEIVPDLRLTGKLGNPVPVGRVELREARAFLPFSVLRIQEGHIDFIESSPWVPQLDVRGVALAQDYTVQAYAYGPLNDQHLVLRSDPPLPQESIVLLLTTGFVPGFYAGEGFGEAAVGQGGLLLLRAILRQFEPEGVDVDSFMNRLQITATPPATQGERAGLRGRFDLWKGISAMSERDSFGFYNVGATYTFRFR